MISELIFKYLNNEASEDEVALVFEWLEKSEENKKDFIALKKVWALSQTSENINKSAFLKLKKQLKKHNKKKKFALWKYAAIIVLAIGLTKTISVIINNKTSNFENNIVIENSDGTIDYILEKETKNIIDTRGNIIGKQTASEIIYSQNSPKAKTVLYNTIKIPYGKTFKITLSDGSIVHLNSGTSFKYPTQFNSTDQRKVFLNGEAFFEVSKDKNRPFIVHSNEIDIEVLGTKFNLSSYEDDLTTHCELVEGLVKISESKNHKNNAILTPNHKFTWDNIKNEFLIENVDVKIYTAWIYGELIFKNEPFQYLSKKLERTYGVTIKNDNKNLAFQEFTGTLKIKESRIEDILDLLKLDTPFSYSRDENLIEISNPIK